MAMKAGVPMFEESPIESVIYYGRIPHQAWTADTMWDMDWSRRWGGLLAHDAGGAGPYANDFGMLRGQPRANIWLAPGVDISAADGSKREHLNGSELVRLGLRPIARIRSLQMIVDARVTDFMAWCRFCVDWVYDEGDIDMCEHMHLCPDAGEKAYCRIPKGRRLHPSSEYRACSHARVSDA